MDTSAVISEIEQSDFNLTGIRSLALLRTIYAIIPSALPNINVAEVIEGIRNIDVIVWTNGLEKIMNNCRHHVADYLHIKRQYSAFFELHSTEEIRASKELHETYKFLVITASRHPFAQASQNMILICALSKLTA